MEIENNNVILVAYDFTAVGDLAIQNAINMAKIINYKVCVLHILNKVSLKNLQKNKETVESITDKLEKLTGEIKKEHKIEADFLIRKGSIFTSIAEVCKEIGTNLLVFGTHGKKGIQFLLGSFAMKLIKSCPVPVMVVQKPAVNVRFSDIVFPLNIEPGSKQKVKWALALHKQFNATIHLFIDSYPDEFIQNRLRADLKQVKKILDKHQIKHTENFSPTKGNFSDNSVAFAKETNADMIMISTDPDKITWSLFGSHDERAIYNQERIPVMCINAQDLRVIIGGL